MGNILIQQKKLGLDAQADINEADCQLHVAQLSHHGEVRMQQRGRRPADLGLIREYGEQIPAGYVMTDKAIRAAERRMKNQLQRLAQLQSWAVIEKGNVVVTMYRASPETLRRLRNRKFRQRKGKSPRHKSSRMAG